MKHYFGRIFDDVSKYWSVVPNNERHLYHIDDFSKKKKIKIVTVYGDSEDWERIFELPELIEIILNDPTKEQLESLGKVKQIKRLIIIQSRLKNLEFIRPMKQVEELVLEYVSGFTDLSPLQSLRKLKSLHLENLRGVTSFEGLRGIKSLRYLNIDGTLDWKQPIKKFNFLEELPNLEVFSLGNVITKAPYPALLPLTGLKKLKKVRISSNVLAAEEFALAEVGLPNVNGTQKGYARKFSHRDMSLPKEDPRWKLSERQIKKKHPEVIVCYDGDRRIADPLHEWFEFTGKNSGRIKCTSLKAAEKCKAFEDKYESMKERARKIFKK